MPSGTRLLQILGDLGVPGADIDEALRLRPRLDEREDLTFAADRSRSELLRGLGRLGEWSAPDLSGATDPLLHHFWLYVFAGAYDEVRAWHHGRGIDPDVGRRTLADLGRHVQHTRRRQGHGGLTLNQDWLSLHFRGSIYQLGRLQFELITLDEDTAAMITADGSPVAAGAAALSVHIPDHCGPFTPAQVDESFALATTFFPAHFPEHRPVAFVCHSWLLDPLLRDHLSPTANMITFADRFRVHRSAEPDDLDFVKTVFGVAGLDDLDALPRTTTLQRVLLDHLAAGGHWHPGTGWRPFA